MEDFRIKEYHNGEIVKGKVVLISGDTIFLNIGAKSEAELPLQEYPQAKIDDVLFCMVVGKDRSGTYRLSYSKAQQRLKQREYEQSIGKQEPKQAKVKEVVKGGIIAVDSGIKVFIPLSQLTRDRKAQLDSLPGQLIQFFVIDRSDDAFIGSELQYERQKIALTREHFWRNLDLKRVYKARVTRVFPTKAFLEVDYVRGFITARNFSYRWDVDLTQELKEGDEIEVMILVYDRKNEKVEFTRKTLLNDPESDYLKIYTPGSIHKGEVSRVYNDYAIIQFTEFAVGRLELEDVSWSRKLRSMKQMLKTGDVVKVKILSYDAQKRLFSVGLKQIMENPWKDVETKYPMGSIVKGKLVKKIEAGFFVEIEPDLEAFVSKEDLTWDKDIEDTAEQYKEGQTVEGVVLKVSQQDKIFRLGIKQMQEDPFLKKIGKLGLQDEIEVKIVDKNKGGFVVEIAENVEGFLPYREIPRRDVDLLEIGQSIKVLVKEINTERRRIILSVKALIDKEVGETIEELKESKPVTLGDLWDNILKERKNG